MYNDFSEVYNKLVFDIDYDFYLETIKKQLMKLNLEPKDILEIGIGTGNLTKRMDFKTDSYIGVDLSSEMLEIASNNLNDKENLQLINADISKFKMENRFDLAISTLDTINYILDEDDLYASFKNIYDSLRANSAFIFDINSENKLRNVLGNNDYIYEYDNIFYTWQSFLDEENNIVDFVLDFFIEENNLYRRITEEQSEKIYSLDYIINILKNIGFEINNYIDFDTGKNIDENSQRILLTVTK